MIPLNPSPESLWHPDEAQAVVLPLFFMGEVSLSRHVPFLALVTAVFGPWAAQWSTWRQRGCFWRRKHDSPLFSAEIFPAGVKSPADLKPNFPTFWLLGPVGSSLYSSKMSSACCKVWANGGKCGIGSPNSTLAFYSAQSKLSNHCLYSIITQAPFQKLHSSSRTTESRHQTVSWCHMFHHTILSFMRTKHEMPDNLINMCCISVSAPALAGRERQAFVRGFLAHRKWLRRDSEGHSSFGKGEWLKTYPFLITACWRIARRKANGDHTRARWQEANFDVPFLSLRCFSFKAESGWASWENSLLPTFPVPELTGGLKAKWNLD